MQKKLLICFFACFGAVFFNPSFCSAREPARLVVYDRNFCVVSERVVFGLEAGENAVRVEDIPELVRPDSVNLQLIDAPGSRVLEQRYLPPAGEETLLKASEGSVISFEITSPDGERWLRDGKIIRAGRNPLVEFDGMLRFGLPGKPLFREMPGGIYPGPSILWRIESSSDAAAQAVLSYITGGITWRANYDIFFSGESDHADLKGRFFITNSSGKTFSAARISLLAGDVGTVQANRGAMFMRSEAFDAAAAMGPPASSRELDEYHLYTLEKAVDLPDGRDADVEFMEASGLKLSREYVFDGAEREKVQVFIEFENSAENNLGAPMPGGRIRLYRLEEGFMILTGEDSISHTPEGETIRLYTGTAFDLAGERKQTGYRNISPREREEDYEIIVRNRKKQEAVINVLERPSQRDWEVKASSENYERIDARTLKFRISVPPGGERKVSYTVRLRW